jgi:hypothetical protein
MPIDHLDWNQTDRDGQAVYKASFAGYDFEICKSAAQGWRLQMWQLRRGNRRVPFWDKDGYTLEEAQWVALQLLGRHVP